MPRLVLLTVHSCVECPFHETNSTHGLSGELIQLCMKQKIIIPDEEYFSKSVPDCCPLSEVDRNVDDLIKYIGECNSDSYLAKLRERLLDEAE